MSWTDPLKVTSRKTFKLADFDAGQTLGWDKGKKAKQRLTENLEALADLQFKLYAEEKQSLLIVLQGIDSAGKDGTIRKVFSVLNPQSCPVTSFKAPSTLERNHDYLWRIHQAAPAAGEIAIFNRSHYEDVLIVRVHELVKEAIWKKRFDQINRFEELLASANTRVLKFFLYISKEEQKARFQARLDDPTRNWKFSRGDLEERKHWDDYIEAFDDALNKCSPKTAPWHVIPANHKWFRNLAISEITRKTLEQMNPQFPVVTDDLSDVVID